MTLSSLSATQPASAQESYDPDELRTLISEYLGIDAKRVIDEAHFSDDLGIDWLDRLELMILIEDRFPGVEITNNDADQIEVVGDLIRHIQNNEQRLKKVRKFCVDSLPINDLSNVYPTCRKGFSWRAGCAVGYASGRLVMWWRCAGPRRPD